MNINIISSCWKEQKTYPLLYCHSSSSYSFSVISSWEKKKRYFRHLSTPNLTGFQLRYFEVMLHILILLPIPKPYWKKGEKFSYLSCCDKGHAQVAEGIINGIQDFLSSRRKMKYSTQNKYICELWGLSDRILHSVKIGLDCCFCFLLRSSCCKFVSCKGAYP